MMPTPTLLHTAAAVDLVTGSATTRVAAMPRTIAVVVEGAAMALVVGLMARQLATDSSLDTALHPAQRTLNHSPDTALEAMVDWAQRLAVATVGTDMEVHQLP
jgi:hypothetical protein